MSTESEIFALFVKKLSAATTRHTVTLEAARDIRLTTDFLIERAMEVVRAERANADDDCPNPALHVLHQRAGDVLEPALDLLDSTDPAARQLGAQMLRELPGLDSAPYPYSPRIISRLGRLVETEPDDEVLGWALAAVGWQRHPSANEVLLRFVGDERASVRRVVANNLLMGGALSAPVANAFLRLAKDADADIRWSVFYDIAEYPELFSSFRDSFREIAGRAQQDSEEEVREQARRAAEALGRGA